jgi:hypothetical protein
MTEMVCAWCDVYVREECRTYDAEDPADRSIDVS